VAVGKRIRIALLVGLGLVVVLALVAGGWVYTNMTYAERDAERVADAGFVEKRVDVNGSRVNYAEGPDNGPALLLVHGQSVDWQNYNRVLPELSERFHIFAVDCLGHGKSARAPEKYTANALAADMEQFVEDVIGEPAIVSGHSSGGLIAAKLAADAPDRVRGVVLEDPPFFSSVLPRAWKTFNQIGLATSAHEFLRSDEKDFTEFELRHGAIWDLFGDAGDSVKQSALKYHANHPGEPVKIFYMPPEMNESFRALDSYDPRFGEAFYDNSFHDGFDHAETLRRISVPAVLIHTNWSFDENGILLAAMSGEDAARARSLIDDVEFYKVDTGHGFHFEDPDQFVEIVDDFEARLGAE
jgi:pimeloyl-ACP methyl ester carboxylesterase